MRLQLNKLFFIALLVFFLASTLLVFLWFNDKSLIGGGETGVPFYDIGRLLDISSHLWINAYLGVYIPQAIANIPLLAMFHWLQALGSPGYILEALFFFMLLFFSLFSMYLLSMEMFPQKGNIAWIFSSFFYVFNLYSMMNIWNRFLLNMMLFYAVLPMFIWIFIRGLSLKRYYYSVFLGLVSVIFSYALSSPGHIVILWSIIIFITFYYFLFISKSFFAFKYLLVSLFVWSFFNFWWVSQQIYFSFSALFKSTSDRFFTTTGNQEALSSLSQALGKIYNLFLLKHGTFFTPLFEFPYNWPTFYNSLFGLVVEWFFFFLVGWVALVRIKRKWVFFLLSLFLIGVFVSKGNSSPLGQIFNYLFTKFSFVQFFRNPFEKLGILMALSFSLLFGFSISQFYLYLSKKRKNISYIFLGVCILYVFVFLGFPYWTRLVFTNDKPPSNDPKIGIKVDVPSYYKDASHFVDTNSADYRYLTLPLGGEGIFYKWPKGYVGAEMSSLLFNTQGVSNAVGITYYYDLVKSLGQLFMQHTDFYKIASILHIKYLIFRPDFDFKLSGMTQPITVEKRMKELVDKPENQLSFASQFGPLKFYSFSDNVLLPKIYPASNIILSDQYSSLNDIFLLNTKPDDAIVIPSKENMQRLSPISSSTILHNATFFRINGPIFPVFIDRPDIFPYVGHTANFPLYRLVLLKEKLQTMIAPSEEVKMNDQLLFLGKRLLEAKMALDIGDVVSYQKSIRVYGDNFDSVVNDLRTISDALKVPNERVWHERQLFETFSSHIYLINQFRSNSLTDKGELSKMEVKIRAGLAHAKILPYYDLLSNDNFPINDRSIYSFDVSKKGNYKVVVPKTVFFPSAFGLKDRLQIQLDDRVVSVDVVDDKDFVSLGSFFFNEGVHEIGLNEISSDNLVSKDNFELNAESDKEEIEIPINNFDPYTQYNVSFDSWTRYGDGFTVAVGLDTDLPPKSSEYLTYYYRKGVFPDDYFYDYKHFSEVINPDPSATSARVIFSVKPWNNCRQIYFKTSYKCNDKSFMKKYNRPSSNIIKNLEVTPEGVRNIALVARNHGNINSPQKITFQKVDNGKYNVSVRGSKGQFLLIFSELFDAGWQGFFVDSNGKKVLIPDKNHILVNGFANGWWIEKTGDFDLTLEFSPQKVLDIGSKVSIVSIGLGLVYTLVVFVRLKRKK